MFVKKSVMVGDRELSIESGRMAKLADGSIVLKYGETMLLATIVSAKDRKDVDFMPLTVEYKENLYAAGKHPPRACRGHPPDHRQPALVEG